MVKKDFYIQSVRGLAIASVVLIHCLPQEPASVALRPFLNSAVATFIFLSGYLTPRKKVTDVGAFLRRRVGKIVVPYLIWTTLYVLANRMLAPTSVLYAFVVGGGSWQMYYLVVYLQLTLLTPWLFRLLDRPASRAMLYAVTPATLVLRYGLVPVSSSLPIQSFCGSWLIFYLLGLEWRERIDPWLRRRGIGARQVLVVLFVCLILQEAEGFTWFVVGNYELATSQLKMTNLLSSLCVCALIPHVSSTVKSLLQNNKVLVHLGDLSFGIFLSHMVFLLVFRKLFEFAGLDGFLPMLVLWFIVLVTSASFIVICRRVLPRRAQIAIGFA